MRESRLRPPSHLSEGSPEKFRKPIPVHLGYFTVWIGDDGKLYDFNDVYGRDRLVGNILFGRV